MNASSQRRLAGRSRRRRIAILSRKKCLYATRRLSEEIRRAGHTPVVIDPLACAVLVTDKGPGLLYRGRPAALPDLVIPRIGASVTEAGLTVLTQLELLGCPSLNRPGGIRQSRDKLMCLQILGASGFPVPATSLVPPGADAEPLLRAVGGLPVVVKLLKGTQGVGVMLARTQEELKTLLSTFGELGHAVLLQHFIGEAKGSDLRLFVTGSRVAGAMCRQARGGEFRSNIHRGGDAVPVSAGRDCERLAVEAAKTLGLEVAGVDLIVSDRGPMLIEVNSSPGFEGLEGATGRNIAASVVARGLELIGARAQT